MGSRTSDEEPPLPQPGRLWTVEEANGRLDELKELLPELKGWAVRIGQIREERERLERFWGKELEASDSPDRALKSRLDAEWESLRRRLEREVGRLAEEGIEVKDLDIGLVDFYSVVEKEVVLLCWQRDEPEIGFFHTISGGFRSRQPLPDSARRAARRPSSTR